MALAPLIFIIEAKIALLGPQNIRGSYPLPLPEAPAPSASKTSHNAAKDFKNRNAHCGMNRLC